MGNCCLQVRARATGSGLHFAESIKHTHPLRSLVSRERIVYPDCALQAIQTSLGRGQQHRDLLAGHHMEYSLHLLGLVLEKFELL